jgi:hypothetical protein
LLFTSNLCYEDLENIMPEDCMLGFLRRAKYSECGFVAYNLRHPAAKAFIDDIKLLYVTDSLFKLREYHDSYVFDQMRRRYERKGFRNHDIANGAGLHHNNVIKYCVLARHVDHLKGDRKYYGTHNQILAA